MASQPAKATTASHLLKRPLLLGCTWYTYGLDSPAWGVAQSDLLFGKAPAALILAPEILCDTQAYEQEEYALAQLEWTSAELLARLKKAGVLRTEEFGPRVKEVFDDQNLRRKLQQVLTIRDSGELLKSVRRIDNEILSALIAEGSGGQAPQTRQAFYWAGAGPQYSPPFWSKDEELVIELFLNSEFYVLPPKAIWPPHVLDALSEIANLQRPHLDDLARLRVEPRAYVDHIKSAHHKFDVIVDHYLRSHAAAPYGNYLDRFDLLLAARKVLQDRATLAKLELAWERVRAGKLSRQEFKLEFAVEIQRDTKELLLATAKSRRDIGLTLVYSVTAAGAWALAQPWPGVGPLSQFAATTMAAFLPRLVRSLWERLCLGPSHPMARFELQRGKAMARSR